MERYLTYLPSSLTSFLATSFFSSFGSGFSSFFISFLVSGFVSLTSSLGCFASFFSFGTNDLTQTTFGISRDDAEASFMVAYMENGILPDNPFATIDKNGVGELMRIAVTKGRSVTPDLECGICGEHGGEPKSIELCHALGLTYVSCSPFRVPIARLAAAHAALQEDQGG